jgi:2-keto-4-pentenoate hydratase
VNDAWFDEGARRLHAAWRDAKRIAHLPVEDRPLSRADGYRLQARLVSLIEDRPIGWKIAATSVAGQQHIGVSGPLAGRILAARTHRDGVAVGIGTNALRVAEAEFGFRMARAVDGVFGRDIEVARVIDSVGALIPAIELPDARLLDVPNAGDAQLIADLACAGPVIFGHDAPDTWRSLDLAAHDVSVLRDGSIVANGRGANVLGDPRVALAWLATELVRHGHRLEAGDLVITGTCVVPVPVAEGHVITADFGALGAVSTRLI